MKDPNHSLTSSTKKSVGNWTTHSTHRVFDARVFSIDKVDRSHDSKRDDFYIINSHDWVNIIAITNENDVLLIEQFRHGTADITIEIPGGLIDPSDPTIESAAARELLEETGFKATSLEYLGYVYPNPALQGNRCHTCLATDIEYSGQQHLDANEEIDVIKIPITDIPQWIKTGRITHSLVIAAFAHYFSLDTKRLAPSTR